MSKRKSNFSNMTITMTSVAFIASLALGFVYERTKEPIEKSVLQRKIRAIRQVVPVFDNNPIEEKKTVGDAEGSFVFYPAKKDGSLVGMAVESSSEHGFSGTIRIIVGFLPDGTIENIAVVEHRETPGLGDKIEAKKSDFIDQFRKKNPATFQLSLEKDGGDVDAITAATYSSRAFCEAAKRAYEAYRKQRMRE